MKVFSKDRIKLIVPCIHFVLSFWLERGIFIFGQEKDVILTIPRNDLISDRGERVLGYIISKLFAAAMIFFLWHLLFWVAENWKDRKNVRFFLGFFLVGLAGVVTVWPDSFLESMDNAITYTYAIRFWPEYWHSAYTSCVYAGMLMVVPSPVFITVFQWIFSVFVLGYLYNRIGDSPVLRGRGKYGVFLFLLMPGTYTLFADPYRTELYALLCMFLVSMTIMDIVDRKKRGMPSLVCNIVLCGFIGVWRTEGVVLGVLLFLVQLVFIYKYKLSGSIPAFACMCVVLVLFWLPQKLGDIKYYGQDYTFINSFGVLRNILASRNSNLSYDGAEEDLAALEAVTPVELLRFYGMDGYRRFNYANGREDINQSYADDETASAYTRAYYRLVVHNLPIYAKTQISALLQVLMLRSYSYIEYWDQPPENDLPPWNLRAWDIGREDLGLSKHARAWMDQQTRREISDWLVAGMNKITDVMEHVYFYSVILILIPLFEIFIFLAEGIRFIGKKENLVAFSWIAFVLLGQAAAIFLVMPVGAFAYFHAYYSCSFLLCLVYVLYLVSRKKSGQEGELDGSF